MPHNELLQPSCNIGTDAHLLFTKSPSSKLQELLGKIFFPLEFLQFHPIVILVYNEWFGWIHNIWVWNENTSVLSFCGFIFPHPSPIIWILRSYHLDSALFLQYNDLLPPLHVFYVGILVELHDIRRYPLSLFGWTLDRIFSSTGDCSPLLLTWKRMTLISDSQFHIPVTFSLP